MQTRVRFRLPVWCAAPRRTLLSPEVNLRTLVTRECKECAVMTTVAAEERESCVAEVCMGGSFSRQGRAPHSYPECKAERATGSGLSGLPRELKTVAHVL